MGYNDLIVLPVNQFDHFYRGGDRIGALRHGPGGPRRPEEWIGSATARFGQAPAGLTVLPDGKDLAEEVSADPNAWLGPIMSIGTAPAPSYWSNCLTSISASRCICTRCVTSRERIWVWRMARPRPGTCSTLPKALG